MVIGRATLTEEIRSNLKDGQGDISFVNLVDKDKMINCRLLTEVTIPVNGSIGEHTHIDETEYYILQSGTALVIDNGQEVTAKAGDIIVTGHNETHSIKNIGDVPLNLVAIIITH